MRISIYATDPDQHGMKTVEGWYDPDAVTVDLDEARDFDGHSHIGRSSSMKINRQNLVRTSGGRWVLTTDRRPEFNGPLERVFVTDEQARQWLLVNDHEETAEKWFGPIGDEHASLRTLGERLAAAQAALDKLKAEYRQACIAEGVGEPGRATKTDAAGWAGITRATLDAWLNRPAGPGQIGFVHEFRATAARLNSFAIAGDWSRLAAKLAEQGVTLTAQDAASWANLGFTPGEAEREIAAGVTLDEARLPDQRRR